MDDILIALFKGLKFIMMWCVILAVVFLCFFLTFHAFEISTLLGFVALFVDAVLVAAVHYYEEPGKKPTGRAL